MKKSKLFKQITSCTLALLLAIPLNVMPQSTEENTAAQSTEMVFEPEELEQILAPIALYPDALLARVLTAAIYPLEVVAADRFVQANQGLEGEALFEAAKDKDWEPSVKAMLEFPDVLAMMDEQLEWTTKLGDAVFAQQGDCMEAVQRLRQKAYAQGNLNTTERQVIRVEPQTQIIIIEPASPEVVYVPVYDTAVIYGYWRHPAYPPYYFYPRRYSGISFFSGVFVGALWGAWGVWDCDWHSRHVYINVPHYNDFKKTHYRKDTHHRSYKDGYDIKPRKNDRQHREGAIYDRQRSEAIVKASTSDFRKYDQGKVGSSMINTKEKPKQTAAASKSSGNNQPRVKKLAVKDLKENKASQVNVRPIVTVDARGSAGKQRTVKASAGNAKAQESTKKSAVVSTAGDSINNQIITMPTWGGSGRNKDDTYTLAAGSKSGSDMGQQAIGSQIAKYSRR